ncbi:MAG: ABC transporter permease [Anaerolineae bacterium]|nr:MAG: ABC transporter permease [Anaerolineae bacterium]
MKLEMLGAVIRKDLVLFFKNRFFAVITVFALFGYAVIYYLLPSQIDETLEIGIFAPAIASALAAPLEEEGVVLEEYASEAALKEAVTQGDVPVGVQFPKDLLALVAGGERPTVDVYLSADLPQEFRDLYPVLVEEWVALMAGNSMTVEFNEQILGVDRAGSLIPTRDRMLPLLAVFILMVEVLGLASLISEEITTGTIRALLITPLSTEGLFTAKGIFGVGFAFAQVTLLMLVTGGLIKQPTLILLILFVGAIMVTGIAFLIASASKDMMSVMWKGMLALLILIIPAMNVLLPGLTTDWIKAIPSFYLVDAVHQVINFDASWSAVWSNVLILAAFAAAFLALGVLALRRQFR